MLRKALLALGLILVTSPAMAQNTTCADRPASDKSNACANTRFVNKAASGSIALPSGQIIVGDNTGVGQARALNGDCTLNSSGTITCLSSAVPIFPTYAIAAAFSPSVAPTYIATAFYDTDQVPDSGALYKNNGTSTGDLVITLSDGITNVGFDISTTRVSASSYGLNPVASGAVNLAAIKSAIARTPIGGTTYVPTGSYTIDTSGGLSAAPMITKSQRFQLDGTLTASFIAQQANPPYIINVASDNVKFSGNGSLAGNGTTFVEPSGGADSIYPGLVYVSGNNFDFTGVTLRTIPQKGIFVNGGSNANLHDFNVVGGDANYQPSTIVDPADPNFGQPNPGYRGSYNAAITLEGGNGHIINNVHSMPDSGGGVITMLVFNAGDGGVSNNLTITNNVVNAPWEKLAYLYGSGHIVANNQILGCYNGFYQTCTYSDVIRFYSSNSIAIGNYAKDVTSLLQSLDSHNNKIIDNIVDGAILTAINVAEHISGETIDRIEVRGNSLKFQSSYVVPANAITYDAITSFVGGVITDNLIDGFTASYGTLLIDGGSIGTNNTTISGNKITTYDIGINIGNAATYNISNNTFRSGSGWSIYLQACNIGTVSNNQGNGQARGVVLDAGTSNLSITNNTWYSSINIGVGNIGSSSNVNLHGNLYGTAPLQGAANLSASSATTTVSNGGVAPEATILLTPANNAAALKFAADGYYAVPSAGDFVITNGNGNTASGATMSYYIVQ